MNKKISLIVLMSMITSTITLSAPPNRTRRVNNIRSGSNNTLQAIPVSKEILTPTAQEEISIVAEVVELTIETKEQQKIINDIQSRLDLKITEAEQNCTGIQKSLNLVQTLAGVSTGVSGVGILTAGAALGTGIGKAITDKKINKLEDLSDLDFYNHVAEIEKRSTEINKLEKTSIALGHARTGLMGASIATSGTSMGTSIASAVEVDKLIKKMKDCNKTISEIKLINSELEAEEATPSERSLKIVEACKTFDISSMSKIKEFMTASSVTSGVGTISAITGTVTSALANSKNVRNDDSQEGKKKENALNLTANITAGLTTGTSIVGTALGAETLKKLKENINIAINCESNL